MTAIGRHLVCREGGSMLTLQAGFDDASLDPGCILREVPGGQGEQWSEWYGQRYRTSAWARMISRGPSTMTRNSVRAGTRAVSKALKPSADKSTPPPGPSDWISGLVFGAAARVASASTVRPASARATICRRW